MFLANKLNKGAGAPPATTDAQFNYVTMLLHGDGTNGAQNNTFLDSSSNTRTITRTGTPTQGSFSPYGDNWSNYFDGSSSYLSTASNATYQFGTGDFTIECWINMAAGTSLTAYWRSFVSVCGDAVFTNAVTLFIGDGASGSSVAGEVIVVIGSNNLRIYGGEDIRNLGWVHVAVTRSGTTLRLFVNGTQKSSGTNSSNINETSYGAQIGVSRVAEANYFIGYVSNVRIVKGTAVYTSAFTPSTTPLTAITNTSLLTCQSNRFVDNSASPLTITVNGTPSVQRFNPFGASTSYSTSVIGGSGYFDTSNYLSVGTLGSASSGVSYCLEMWVYPTSFRGADEMRLCGAETNDPLLQFSGNTDLQFFVANTFICGYSATFKPNQWYHIAVTRSSGNTTTIYLNGVSVATGSNSLTLNTNTFLVGAHPTSPTIGLIGYMTDFRAVLGSVVYSSNFTPPTAPLTNITNTSLLCNFTNGAIFDNAMMNDLETVGNAQISTSVKKYGTGSLAFDGSGDYLNGQVSPNLSFGTGDFTIEGWGYVTSTSTTFQCMLSIGAPVQIYARSGTIKIYFNDTDDNITYIVNGAEGPTSSISANTWFHFAVVRNGTTFTAYVDGVAGTPTTGISNEVALSANPISLGIYGGNLTLPFTGYLDDLRITKGYARYTANFTPPTAAFFDTGPV